MSPPLPILTPGAGFMDLGDQFLALMEGPVRQPEGTQYSGWADDNTFLDPWGNRVEVLAYRDVQFTKAEAVARGLGLDPAKTPEALGQLRAKGMAPEGA